MLELMPIAYTVRIRTSSNNVYQHTRAELEGPPAASDDARQDAAFRVS